MSGSIKRNPRTRSVTDFLRRRTERFSYERPLSFFLESFISNRIFCGRIGSRG